MDVCSTVFLKLGYDMYLINISLGQKVQWQEYISKMFCCKRFFFFIRVGLVKIKQLKEYFESY